MNLVERERELGVLRALYEECVASHGRVVVVRGAVASGKSVLWRSLAEHVTEDGAVVLEAAAAFARRPVPLGLVRRLFRTASPAGRDVDRLLDEGVGLATLPGGGPRYETVDRALEPLLRALCDIVLELAERAPVVIAVDDVHDADATSLQFLLYLAYRVRSARVLIVLNELVGPWQEYPLFHAELLSQPHGRRLWLRPLSPAGVHRMLADRFDGEPSARLAEQCHAMTGGNPLLLGALLTDNPGDLTGRDEPMVGAAFSRAVTSCLDRGDPAVLRVARALAVLSEPATPDFLGRLLGLGAEYVSRTLDAMRMAGLSDRGRFRHPAVRAVVLDGMTPRERSELHDLVARLLHVQGAAPAVVAPHLVAATADQIDVSWAVPVLEKVAEESLGTGDSRLAQSCLRLAHECSPDAVTRARVAGARARVTWLVNPAGTERLLPELVAAAREVRLDHATALVVLGCLLWHGRTDDALAVVHRQAAVASGRQLAAMVTMVTCAYPALLDRAPGRRPWRDGRGAAVAPGRDLRLGAGLLAVLHGTADQDDLETAAQFLTGARPDVASTMCVAGALATLVYGGRTERAVELGAPFLRAAAAGSWPATHAVLAAVTALAAIHDDDPVAAEEHARTALARLGPAGWGVAVGYPLAVLVLAATAQGRYEDAATHLVVPVPEAMFETPAGLHYLHASGRYHLATGHPHAALGDFQRCGELAAQWGFVAPGFVAWRADLARALAALGERSRAVAVARGQLALLPPGPSRDRRDTLRLLADLGAEVASDAGSETGSDVGSGAGVGSWAREAGSGGATTAAPPDGPGRRNGHPARPAAGPGARPGRVRIPAAASPAGPAPASPPPGPSTAGSTGASTGGSTRAPAEVAGVEGAAGLTGAELRVATLAADGRTNREIAESLRVTVSTVEQHLTHVYRKLRVRRRTALGARLSAGRLHPDGHLQP